MERAPFGFAPPGRAICRYRLTAAEAEAEFGPPHYGPEGPRRLPAWGFELGCGLIIEVQLDVENEQALLHSELRELEHALRHLDLGDRILWRMDEDREAFERALEEYHPVSWGRWSVVRRLEDGDLEAVADCLSPSDARCRAHALEAAGQSALVEEQPKSRAHDRRAALTAGRPAKRSASGPRWEVWWVQGDAASLLHLAPSEAEARAWCEASSRAGPGQWDVRARNG